VTERRITFAVHLDGQRATQPGNTLGESVLGPLGLLNFLETQLGLAALYPSQAERIVQYRNCLQNLDTDDRFYHRSLSVDPMGTTACLLDWRDQWALFGWDGMMPDHSPKRLQDLAEVESIASTAVSPNTGQRLKAVKAALQNRKLDIKIRSMDSVASLPARWRAVLAEFPVTEIGEPKGAGIGFLGALQASLKAAAAGQSTTKRVWQDDGTVVVARAETRALAAQWLATQLENKQSALLVCGEGGAGLDAHLAAAGRPRQGLKEASAFRPALQVLPLAMELLWSPLNYYALVQFLTHPVCPIPGFARRRLAEKIADAPGVGGEYWQRALDDIDGHYEDERRLKVRDQITFWVEHDRFQPEDGAKLDSVIQRVDRLAEFFRLRLGETDQTKRLAFHAGYAQCRACLDSLKGLLAQGVEQIRPRQLQKLVAQATANGSDNQLWPAEVGAQQIVLHPGAVVEAAARVIWWQLSMPILPGIGPWSSREVCALREAGVALPDVSDLLDRVAKEWLRPVMAAREQLLLILPPPTEEIHPLWQMIEAIIEQPKVTRIEGVLQSGGDSMAAVTPVPLLAPKRWWTLPNGISVSLRKKESFSSLELLLFNPYQWLLRYPVGLRPSRLISVGGDFRILGNLAHGLVEQYFLREDSLSMSDADFNNWFTKSFAEIVDHEGAILRIPGRGADLEGFRFRLLRSMQTLREQIARAHAVKVVPEQSLSGRFEGGELAGSADLVLLNDHGESAIVDMKWAGVKKYPDKLKENRHLQLAIYAELLRQEKRRWPSVAYHILDRARFFAPDDGFFPDAEVIQSQSGENTADLWDRFVNTWRWRIKQIQAGRFEVVLECTQPTEESEPPADALPIETLDESYNDYLALAGLEN
jgi:PD-(D/E)XK nuclease superfamily